MPALPLTGFCQVHKTIHSQHHLSSAVEKMYFRGENDIWRKPKAV